MFSDSLGGSTEVSSSKSSDSEMSHTPIAQAVARRPMRSTARPAYGRHRARRLVKDGTACSEGETDAENTQDLQCLEKELKNLTLDTNGKFMTDFDPEKSQREMRKLKRKIHKDKEKPKQLYDEKGLLLENSMDLCDCLDKDCPGCHFPCPKCSSEKCGTECRINRAWLFEQIEVEGTNLTIKWTATKLS